MFIVLGFIVVGIATTLRIQEYQAKKLLLHLILVALLINFSNVFVGIIVDASNIATKQFLKVGGGISDDIVKKIYDANVALGASKGGWKTIAKNINEYIMLSLPFSVMFLTVAVTFFYMAFIFIARQAVLAVLFILSPIAFFCWIFPQTKKIWSMWWENFVKWAFIGAMAGFFVYIAWVMLSNMGTKTTDFVLITICVFLFVGFKITTKSSGLGASAVIGLAGGALGFAMGAVAKGGMGALGATGLKGLAQRAGAGVKDKVTAAGEKYGLVSWGATDSNKAKRLEEPRKRLENIQDNDQLAKIAEQRPITHQQMQDKAVAAEILAKRKALDKINPNKMEAVAAHAKAMGVSAETFTKERPQTFAGATDTDAHNKIMADWAANLMKTNPTMTSDQALKAAKSATPPTAGEIRQARTDLRAQRTTENALGLAPITDGDVQNKIIADKQKEFVARGRTYEEAQALTKGMQVSPEQIALNRQSLAQERIQKGFSKLGGEGIGKLPGEALKSKEFIESVQSKRIAQSGRFLSGQGADDIKSHIPYLRAEMAKAGVGTDRYDALKEKLDEILAL